MCIRDSTYTDQSVIQNEDEFPATDDKIDNGEKEETKLVKDANAGQKTVSYTHLDVYKRQV